jgi:hypothetical protein
MDHHVAEQPVRARHVVQGRREGVAAGDGQLLQPADAARLDALAHCGMATVEAAVEAQEHLALRLLAHGGDEVAAGMIAGGQRLLAEHRLAGPHRLMEQLDMGVGQGGDHDRIDRRVGHRLGGALAGSSSASTRSQPTIDGKPSAV